MKQHLQEFSVSKECLADAKMRLTPTCLDIRPHMVHTNTLEGWEAAPAGSHPEHA